ncbi:MAG: hypothetical protein NWE93_05985 [Candidatus Bathyarchaeota archaeon]|nr:hypothetical protein [Candidatus Bathyarchaeota archaeon]
MLTLTGILLCLLAAIILNSTPFTALGISTIILGAVAFAIEKGQPKIPPQASAILLQSGIENISALVEELGLKTKAIYLPMSITGDKPKALIPLDSQIELDKKTMPRRLIVKYGSRPQDIGLLVITPGSAAGGYVESKADATAGDLEAAVSNVLAGTMALADGVRVSMDNVAVLLEVLNPRLENQNMWIYGCIGSPIASIAASIIAQALDKPVTIEAEKANRSKLIVELKVLERKP